MSFKDYFSKQAAAYTHYRPHYPAALFDYLASLCPAHTQALDVATGSGQAALELAHHFATVFACDASLSQLQHAIPEKQVLYSCASSEQLPFKGNSMDLISVAQAAHWFELPRFYSEVQRLLKPGGVLALWCYGLFHIDQDIDAVIHDYYQHTVGDYWPAERKLIEDGYRTLPFPFKLLDPPAFELQVQWTLDEVIGYLGTWSATQRYIDQQQHNPLPALREQLEAYWPDTNEARTIAWPLHIKAGHKQ